LVGEEGGTAVGPGACKQPKHSPSLFWRASTGGEGTPSSGGWAVPHVCQCQQGPPSCARPPPVLASAAPHAGDDAGGMPSLTSSRARFLASVLLQGGEQWSLRRWGSVYWLRERSSVGHAGVYPVCTGARVLWGMMRFQVYCWPDKASPSPGCAPSTNCTGSTSPPCLST